MTDWRSLFFSQNTWTYFTSFSSVSIVDFKKVSVSWSWVTKWGYYNIQKIFMLGHHRKLGCDIIL